MILLKKFYEYTESAGFGKEDIQEEKGDDFTLVSFFEEGEVGILYNVALVFYDDENAEVYIRKHLQNVDLFSVLQRINELNERYCGVAFLISDNMLTVKSYVKTNGDLELLLKEIVHNMKLAQLEFVNFK